MRNLYRLVRCVWWLTRPVTVGVKGLIFTEDQRVLLVRHTYQLGWQLPGGKVEKGESPSEALVRELKEELGVDCSASGQRLLGLFANFADFKNDYVSVFVIDGYRPHKLRPHWLEIADCGFFKLDDLPTDTTEATRRRIREGRGEADIAANW